MPSQKKLNLPPSPLLQQLKKSLSKARRIAVIGVGNDLRADDIAGSAIAEAIQKSRKRPSNLQAFIGYSAPENITGEVTKFLAKSKGHAAHIIIVDAADIGLKPGGAKLLEAEAIAGTSFSTHLLPLAILIAYFKNQINCGISVIGIQPKVTTFGKPPSKEILLAIKSVTSAILSSVS